VVFLVPFACPLSGVFVTSVSTGLGDVTADDAEELLARLHSVEWKGLMRDEVERLVHVLHAFMLDVQICPPSFLDPVVPTWMGARQFLKVHVPPMPLSAQG
jgi:hypothetical protein